MTATGPLRRALGVTRVARVTALDRAGVEVACAVRPGGHVLQVTNGKGFRWEDAEAGALLEAAELAAAERVVAADLHWASVGELRRRGAPHVAPAALGGTADAGLVLAWRRARDLLSREELLVPAAAVHVPPPGGPLLGAAGLRWTSNGMGAHVSTSRAVLHALLEAIERDGVARALPGGWTARQMRRRRIAAEQSGAASVRLAALLRHLRSASFDAHLFDLGDRQPAPAIRGALLVDRRRGPVTLTAGYACRLDASEASAAALLEAAQSRLTDIHGAREDVAPASADAAADLVAAACAGAVGRPPAGAASATHRSRARTGAPARPRRSDAGAEREVRDVLAWLRLAGHGVAAVAELGWPGLDVAVVKVIVPGLALSGLL